MGRISYIFTEISGKEYYTMERKRFLKVLTINVYCYMIVS